MDSSGNNSMEYLSYMPPPPKTAETLPPKKPPPKQMITAQSHLIKKCMASTLFTP